MKQILLVFTLMFFVSLGYSQTSFKERLEFKPPKKERIDIKVFPNPAENFIRVTPDNRIRKIQVYNLVGKEVQSYTYQDNQQYSVADLPKGIYLVRIVDSNNKILVTRRISKR